MPVVVVLIIYRSISKFSHFFHEQYEYPLYYYYDRLSYVDKLWLVFWIIEWPVLDRKFVILPPRNLNIRLLESVYGKGELGYLYSVLTTKSVFQ